MRSSPDTGSVPARFYHPSDGSVVCDLCNHHCHIAEGSTGRCGVRCLREGTLIAATYGLVSAEAVDPIEKKPLYHFLPGTTSYSLGSTGCNFSCSHCQNWHISQADPGQIPLREIPPEEGIYRAVRNRCASISWTYNEPTIWYEYTRDMAELARTAGLGTVYVTNGYITGEAMKEIAPYLNAWRVDIKAMHESFYREVCHARLGPVLETTRLAAELGLHIETVTLLIPGLNDSEEELRDLISWVVTELGPDTPMHFTRFHPDYRMQEYPATPVPVLEKAYTMAREMGIRYPYIGNVASHPYEHTYCPECGNKVINRSGFTAYPIQLDGTACKNCGAEIAVIRSV